MRMSALPLPLSCTINTASTPISKNCESAFVKNNRFRAKIGLPSRALSVTTVQLDATFIGNSYSDQPIVNTTGIEDGEDNEMTMC